MQLISYLGVFTLLILSARSSPLPLNINLGAYSPALVVGDGALTFEGHEKARRDIANEAPYVHKRQLAGFDRALTFAEAALTKGPKIQLGSGQDGAGVGIIVDNNINAAARAGKGTGA